MTASAGERGSEATFSLAPYAYADARALVEELELAEPVAVTLVRRGFRTVPQARAFLEAAESHDAFEFDGMPDAVARLERAIGAGERITVHGDYDVDGVCSTAILLGALRRLGADCDWYIPGRLEDGYGLSAAGIERLRARGTRLLVTVDCGIGSVDEVAAARRAGLEVIVTDHHEPGERLPDCPVLHPRVCGYPCESLCAAGVAHKLACALGGEEAAGRDLDLVALATVADLVPLRGENRSLTRRGLAAARSAPRVGLRALAEVAGVAVERLDEGDVSFRIAPRINAAGRMHRADAGVELMLTDDPERARAIAGELERANRERREAEREVLEGAERARAALAAEVAEAPALVLAGEGWHPGVVGIVASRLAERHWRPVVLIGLDAEGRGRGSGRSVPGFDLLGALTACERHLIRFGGHAAAAGLEIDAAEVEAFRAALIGHAVAAFGDGGPTRTEEVDAVVGAEALGLDVAEQLSRLGPFGRGNPDVRLLVPGARLSDVRPMGEGDRHARFSLQSGSRKARGVAFGINGGLDAAGAEALDVSVTLEVNEWNGVVEPRVVLGELYPGVEAEASGDPLPDDEQWWRRHDEELGADLARWPVQPAVAGPTREVVDRRGGSGIAAVAALASSGETVLAICADALVRRGLIERAARPARFGAAGAVLAASALCDERTARASAELLEAGSGVVLADWARLERDPLMALDFAHVVCIDPPPFAHLASAVEAAPADGGFLHLAWSAGDMELWLRVLDEQLARRPALTGAFRALRQAADGGPVGAEGVRQALTGTGRRARSAEAVARCLRVLGETGAVRWEGSGAARRLGVVSSEATELSRSGAFLAYGRRHEEGRRFLSGRGQAS